MKYQELLKHAFPPLEIVAAADNHKYDEGIHSDIREPIQTRLERSIGLSKIEKSHIQDSCEPGERSLSPRKEPWLLDNRKECYDIDDTREYDSIEYIFREVPIEKHDDRERETEVIKPVNTNLRNTTNPISDTKNTDRDDERHKWDQGIVLSSYE